MLTSIAPTRNRGLRGLRSLRPLLSAIVHLSYSVSAALSFAPTPSFSNDGQRYLHIISESPINPPLLIIPGTAQSTELWEQHLPFFTKSRSVLICEPVGVGKQVPRNVDMSIPSQAEILYQTLQSLNDCEIDTAYDVAGFSLGGRIALALACLHSEKVNRLHLTGVALRRSSWGSLQIAAWKDLLATSGDSLRPFAWSALLASYSPDFLKAQKEKLPLWIDGLCQCHTVHGLRELVHQTHDEDNTEWSVQAMAERLPGRIAGRLCVGRGDQLSPPSQVEALAKVLRWPKPSIFSRAGHVPPIETPREWRRDLEDFLDKSRNEEP